MGYEHDIGLEQKHAKMIKAILGTVFIAQDEFADKHLGTDFAIFSVKPFSVGARLRRHCYMGRYGDEFTIRWARPSGVPTEIDKIRRGLVDYIFYGFVDEAEAKIVQWFVGDLKVFREAEPQPHAILPNDPPDSKLAAYKIAQMPEGFVVKQWQAQAPSCFV